MSASTPARPAEGFILVELLVAMALVATLTAGGLAAFARTNTTWRAQATDQRRYERAQYVFGTLEPDLQMAGYFGAARPASALPASTIPVSVSACGLDVIARLDMPVERLTSLPAACVSRATMLPGSDVLLVRRVSARVSAPRAGRAQWLTQGDSFVRGSLIWDGQVPADAANPEIRELVVRMYYVARSADGDASTPALRVKTLTEVAGVPAFVDTEVMPGVEFLEVQLLPPAAPRSVRFSLRIRADSADSNAQDARHALSLTRHFTIRNSLPDAI